MSSEGTGNDSGSGERRPAPENRESSDRRTGSQLERVLDRYLEELAQGQEPDQQAYLETYPELAEGLRGVFRTLEFVEASSELLGPLHLEQGRMLGEFRIIREIARGGMGVVYEAHQTSLDRPVALKVLPASARLSEHALERFNRESSTAARLQHAHIVPIYAVGEEQGVHYFAMQLIEGPSLAAMLDELRERESALDGDHFERMARWSAQVADALAYSHAQSTIHRDIKPSNLLLDSGGKVWISDFGLARSEAQATITASGDIVGTARFMSPEQARGGRERVDERSDVYSLGVTLYELLTLTPAFAGDSTEDVLRRVAFEAPRRPRQLAPRLPRDLETIVVKAMEKEPARRYQRAADLREDLERFLAGRPIRARRITPLGHAARFAMRHRLAALVALAITVAIGTAIWLALEARREEGLRRQEDALYEILFERDYARAAALLDEASTRGVDTAELHLYRALIPLQTSRPHEALEHLAEVLRRDPENVEARLAQALAYIGTGDYNRGRRLVDEISAEQIGDSYLGWLLHGHVQSNTQHSRAIESYNRAIELRPDFTPAIAARGSFRGIRLLCEGARGELEPLLSDCNALVLLRPRSSYSYAMRAYGWQCAAAFAGTLEQREEERIEWIERARSDLDSAIALRRPGDTFALVWKGIFLRTTGDLEGAREVFEAAFDRSADPPWGQDYSLAHKHSMVVYALGRIEAALSEVETAHGHMPDFYPLGIERALLLAELGRVEEAREVCRELARRHARHANALFLAVVMLELLGAPGEAARICEAFANQPAEEVTQEDWTRSAFENSLEFLAGRRSAEEALAELAELPGPRCELAFLAALRRLGRGDRTGGLEALEICTASGIFRFMEHRFAQVMQARAAADPRWPRWISSGGEER